MNSMVLICVDLAIAVQDNVDDFGALAEVLLNRRKLVADSMYSTSVNPKKVLSQINSSRELLTRSASQ